MKAEEVQLVAMLVTATELGYTAAMEAAVKMALQLESAGSRFIATAQVREREARKESADAWEIGRQRMERRRPLTR